MSDRKQVWELVKFEFTSMSLWQYLIALFVIVFTAFFFEIFLTDVTERDIGLPTVFTDLILLVAVVFFPHWSKSVPFRVADLKGGLYATPFYVYVTQLPVKQHILMLSRFVAALLYSVVSAAGAIVLAYVYPGTVQSLFNLGELTVFLIIWALIATAAAGLFAAADVGGNFSKTALFGYNILYFIVLIILLTGLRLLTGRGFAAWTVELATNAPLIGIGLAIVFALICGWICHSEARRYARKVNYYV